MIWSPSVLQTPKKCTEKVDLKNIEPTCCGEYGIKTFCAQS
jgi:hypothetical protein